MIRELLRDGGYAFCQAGALVKPRQCGSFRRHFDGLLLLILCQL
jgi:hypothetical protein